MSDRTRIENPELIARVLPRGAAFILRDYDAPRRAILARRLQAICRARKILFFVGGDVALARSLGAEGVHLPAWMQAAARHGMMASASCHSAGALEDAAARGVRVAFLSPAFETKSHPHARALDAARFKALAAAAPLPVLALGGVDETNAARLSGPNVAGLAAIGAFLPR